MANVIGEPIPGYVANQIEARQKLHGSGVYLPENQRTDNQINLLNANTSWIKLGSGVSVSSSRLEDIGFSPAQQELYDGMGLAKNNILFGGTSTLGINEVKTDKGIKKYDVLDQRDGFLPNSPNSSYTYDSKFGYSPMAGIESVDIKTLNRGSLKKATVKLKANDRSQFNIIDLLYLRLGYTVLLEWGNTFFTPDGVDRMIIRNTLMEEMFFNKVQNGSYLDLLDPIEKKRQYYAGNYDALFGKVSNFSWSFNDDGSYDIELTIISLGDVIESLKTNISVDSKTSRFLQAVGSTSSGKDSNSSQPEEPDLIEDNKDANTISSLLYVWKYLNKKPSTSKPIKIITTGDKKEYTVGNFLKKSQEGVAEGSIKATEYVVQFVITYDQFVGLNTSGGGNVLEGVEFKAGGSL
jgi:hypothetical protein